MSARSPEETHELLEAAFNDGDLEAFVDVYDEDALLVIPPAGRRVSGRAQIRDAMHDTFELRPRASIEVLDKLEAGGLALTLARWSLAGTDPNGQAVSLEGRGTIVSRRQTDGSWRIVLDQPMRADQTASPTILAIARGPLKLDGATSVRGADGREHALGAGSCYLCRCGGSANKPFCDGTHARIGFESTEQH